MEGRSQQQPDQGQGELRRRCREASVETGSESRGRLGMKVLFETPSLEDGVLPWVRREKLRVGCGQACLRLPEEYMFLLGARETRQEGQPERLRVHKEKLSSGQE